MTDLAFQNFVIDAGVIGFFAEPLTLKSGRRSHFYVNWRKATNDAYQLDQLSDFLAAFVQQNALECDTLYGVPEGASKTAVITAMKLARRAPQFAPGSHVISMGRAKPKEHGDPADRYFIGQPRGRTWVLEDTVTTGLSLFKCLDQLLEAGIDVRGVICLTDRCERRDDGKTVAATLTERYGSRLSYRAMSRAPDLLGLMIRKQKPAPALLSALAAELGLSPSDLS